MLREKSSDIASFVEHSVYNIFKMYCALILVVLLWFATIHPKCMCKTHLFLKILGAPAKETVTFFLLWISLYIGFSNCIVSLFWFFYFALLVFTQSACVKVFFSWTFRCSVKEAMNNLPSYNWNILPSYIKPSGSVCEFKNNIKTFRNFDCGCLICRTWI